MIPYVVPLGVFFALAAIRLAPRVAARYSLVDAAAWSLSALLVMTGLAHFIGLREDMIRMVPPLFPRPDLIVTVTGVLELIGAAALIPRRTRNAAGLRSRSCSSRCCPRTSTPRRRASRSAANL
jgi:hypothetical protein